MAEMSDKDRKEAALRKREEVRNYIVNERDTIVKKWRCLEESIQAEDRRRENFFKKKATADTRILPDTIDRFLRTLKKSLGKTMREKGGTPYSIVRNMFIYWDSAKMGLLSGADLSRCLDALGVHLEADQISEIVKFYSDGKGGELMGYNKLLQDLLVGEPSLVQAAPTERETEDDRAKRFKMKEDQYLKKPRLVEKFLEAVRDSIMKKLTLEGGTPYSHVRHSFLMFDYNYSNALDVEELTKAVNLNMGLRITEEQAEEIIKYYDRNNVGEMDYKIFLPDVCEGMDVFLTYTEDTPRRVAAHKKSMQKNPFVIKDFKAAPNKTVEIFKRKVRTSLENKIAFYGGTITSWVRDAFSRWDPTFSGRVASWKHMQGACKIFGFLLADTEAKQIMANYATDDSGSIEYHRLITDILADDPHFLEMPESQHKSESATSRAPEGVKNSIKKFHSCLYTFARHSNSDVDPKDVMYGTFLRVDKAQNKAHTGRVDESGFRKVLKVLKLDMTPQEVTDMMVWFDSNGSRNIDYNEFATQLFGKDILLAKTMKLPAISLNMTKSGKDYMKMTGLDKKPHVLCHHGLIKHECEICTAEKEFKSRNRKLLEKEARKKIIQEEKHAIVNKLINGNIN